MSIESDLYQALRGLVSDRVYPLTFPQGLTLPVWPAIRYAFVSADAATDLCGDNGDVTADVRVQVDAVALTFKDMRALRLQVLSAMEDFDPPAIWSGDFEEFDAETKTFRCSLDFVIYPSST